MRENNESSFYKRKFPVTNMSAPSKANARLAAASVCRRNIAEMSASYQNVP